MNKNNIREATQKWIEKSFQAIPQSIIFKAYVENDGEEIKILTNNLEGEGDEYLSYFNFPEFVHSFFLVSERIDVEWILRNIESLEKHGFDVYESHDHLFIAINGIGYDHIAEHWEKLYVERGLMWHQ